MPDRWTVAGVRSCPCPFRRHRRAAVDNGCQAPVEIWLKCDHLLHELLDLGRPFVPGRPCDVFVNRVGRQQSSAAKSWRFHAETYASSKAFPDDIADVVRFSCCAEALASRIKH